MLSGSRGYCAARKIKTNKHYGRLDYGYLAAHPHSSYIHGYRLHGSTTQGPDRGAGVVVKAAEQFSLYLRGPARLELNGQPLTLRRKGLALLYVLALEGPTRRERLADLLWGHGGAANNLRVELHRLRSAFAEYGTAVFEDGVDPLTLPSAITLEASGTADVMEGLEDLSPEFSDWLDVQRVSHMVDSEDRTPERSTLLDELLMRVRAPFVLVVRVRPGSSAMPLARELAARLKLPFTDGIGASGPALHLIGAEEAPELWRTVAADETGIWVLERRSLGEDPPLLLTLRSRLPAERMGYLELPPVSWLEARQDQLADLSFETAARHYLASGGHRGYLRELTGLPSVEGEAEDGTLQVPQRIRAAYLLEAQKLSAGARHAIERLSVLHGPYHPTLLERMGVTEHLDELERYEWLAWGDYWSFTDAAARTVLHASLQSGRRRRYEAEAKAVLAALPGSPDVRPPTPHTALPQIPSGVGRRYTHWSSRPFGPGVTRRGDSFTLVRVGNEDEPNGVTVMQLANEPLLLHLRGRSYAAVAGYHRGLALKLLVAERREAVYLAPLEPQNSVIDHWFYLEDPSAVRVESWAPAAVLEFELEVYFATKPTLTTSQDLRSGEARQLPFPGGVRLSGVLSLREDSPLGRPSPQTTQSDFRDQ